MTRVQSAMKAFRKNLPAKFAFVGVFGFFACLDTDFPSSKWHVITAICIVIVLFFGEALWAAVQARHDNGEQ